MRPRVFPAEGRRTLPAPHWTPWGFNEGRGYSPRKTHSQGFTRPSICAASMRPRVFPAEDFQTLNTRKTESLLQ